MSEINHLVGIKATSEQVYSALTTDAGLMMWWTNDVNGAGSIGSTIEFRFNGLGPDFKVIQLVENKLVGWQHTGNVPQAWAGTIIKFEIDEAPEQTFVKFTQSNWLENSSFKAHCSTKWAVFLLSLKDALETNTGKPFPDDIQIDHA
jgi:uncharacterized protein YndB with AHSA1/START domain